MKPKIASKQHANTASSRAWKIYPAVSLEDGCARTVYIAGYLAGIAARSKSKRSKP